MEILTTAYVGYCYYYIAIKYIFYKTIFLSMGISSHFFMSKNDIVNFIRSNVRYLSSFWKKQDRKAYLNIYSDFEMMECSESHELEDY